MSHSLTRIWIHAVWSTKDRFPFLNKEKRIKIVNHLKTRFEESECGVRIINGTEDHLHALFILNQNESIKDIIKNVKGETSHWINQSNFYKAKFSWQIGYGAFSVSESLVKNVEQYIKNQEKHHKKMSFQEELNKFLKAYGLLDQVTP
ncbi:MAG: IS200/IS605 family transposase [Candidatus Cloacimonadota bacterium]|nr:MAG: IS200/IS605 family transposase [Candidatus Cloacimonadota bacterium]